MTERSEALIGRVLDTTHKESMAAFAQFVHQVMNPDLENPRVAFVLIAVQVSGDKEGQLDFVSNGKPDTVRAMMRDLIKKLEN